jgi:capsular exopolysaccharide synthesis family protein
MASYPPLPESNGPSNGGRPPNGSSNGHAGNGHASDGDLRSQLYPEDDDPNANPGLQKLWGLLGMLRQGKWTLLLVFTLVVGAVGGYTYLAERTYRASTEVLVNEPEGKSVVASLTGSSSSSGSSLLGGERNLNNEVYVINRSAGLAARVAERLDTLEVNPHTQDTLAILYTEAGARRSVGQIAGLVQERTQARTVGGNIDAIQIQSSSTVPSEAALIANFYGDAYVDWTRDRSSERIQASRKFLEDQASKLERELEGVESRLADYMKEGDAVSLDQESSRIVDQLSSLEARRDELRIQLGMAESALNTQKQELAQIRPRLAERMSSGIKQVLEQVQQEKAKLESSINEIRRRNPNLTPSDDTPRARNLAQLERRAQNLEREADSLANLYVEQALAARGVGAGSSGKEGEGGESGVSYVVQLQRNIAQQEIKVNGLRAQIETIEGRIDEYQAKLQNLPPTSLRMAQLQRERQSVEQIYSFVRQKLQQTRMAEESELGYAEVVQGAGIPAIPVSPNVYQNIIFACLLGFLLGGAVVYVRSEMDTRIRVPEELEQAGHRVTGVVPSMEGLLGNLGTNGRVEVDGRSIRSSLVMLTSPMSAAAEAYRRIRTNLRFAQPDGSMQSVVVTSASQREGKTTTASNLALAMASAGKRTLLVDADLRRPRVHQHFDLERGPGLTEVLFGTAAEEVVWTDVDHMSVLTAGEGIPNSAEVLGSERMREFIQAMKERFEVVIIDTPPVLLFDDPAALAPHADGTLLVASAGQTDLGALKHTTSILDDVHAARIGTVLNGFHPDKQQYAYGYYQYGYRYSSYGYRYGEDALAEYYEDRETGAPDGSSRSSWWN